MNMLGDKFTDIGTFVRRTSLARVATVIETLEFDYEGIFDMKSTSRRRVSRADAVLSWDSSLLHSTRICTQNSSAQRTLKPRVAGSLHHR